MILLVDSECPDQSDQSIRSPYIITIFNFDPLKPHFYIVKLGYTLFFFFSAQKQIVGTR